MSRLFFLLSVFVFIVVLGCKKENDMPELLEEEEVICPSQDSFYITGLLNGKVWKTKTHSFFHRFQFERFVVSVGGNDGDSGASFMDGGTLNLVTEANVHLQKTPLDAFFVFLYGDVTGEFYKIPERDTARNWIEISYLDADNQIVEGTFEVFLKKRDNIETSRPEPDSIEILDGCFRLAREN